MIEYKGKLFDCTTEEEAEKLLNFTADTTVEQSLKEENESTKYARLRAEEYPSLSEQLDMQYWDNVNGTTIWKDTIEAIKAKYPKV